MDAKRLAEALKSLDNQNFGPNDSVLASTINHPVNAGGKFLDWLKNQVNTAAGIPDQYDNPNPLLAPKGQEQAAFDLAGMAQLGSMPFAPKSAGGTLGSITAWHGSPHKFDKFDMSKIGTGEGNRAQGEGLYFAGAKDNVTRYAEGFGDDYKQGGGNIYKVNLEWPDKSRELAEPLSDNHFLDYDKPLKEQSDFIRPKIEQILNEMGIDAANENPTGRRLIDAMFEDDLKNAGVPGLRYAAPGERRGETSNYVLFDDQIPKIKERNGQPLQSDNLNAGLLAKYLREGQLSPQELAQYETNAVQMTDSGKHHFNLANANSQGGTPESRALDLGFDTDAFKASYPYDYRTDDLISSFESKGADALHDKYAGKNGGFAGFFANSPDISNKFGFRGGASYPVKLNMDDARIIDASGTYAGDHQFYDNNSRFEQSNNSLVDVFKDAIYDKGKGGAILENTLDEGNVLIPSKPNQVRSRFAAFDPLRKDSDNLLATRLLPATMLGYGMANQKPDNQSLAEALRGQ